MAVQVVQGGRVFYRNWVTHSFQWSKACYRGGDGQCDGFDCNCVCHEDWDGEFADAHTVEQMKQAHENYWAGDEEDEGR